MDKATLKKLIDTATGRTPADLCIKNANAVNVFHQKLFMTDILISDGIH